MSEHIDKNGKTCYPINTIQFIPTDKKQAIGNAIDLQNEASMIFILLLLWVIVLQVISTFTSMTMWSHVCMEVACWTPPFICFLVVRSRYLKMFADLEKDWDEMDSPTHRDYFNFRH